jgi:autoinducer 2-degrading protein
LKFNLCFFKLFDIASYQKMLIDFNKEKNLKFPQRDSKRGVKMNVTIVNVHVRPENVDQFIAASKKNHRASIKEYGNLRFDFLQSKEDPTRFVLYEAYESEEAAAAHKKTSHYLEWRNTVANWMAEPRKGDPYFILEPGRKDFF